MFVQEFQKHKKNCLIQIQAKLEFEGRQMKNPTRSTPQILSVRPDLVRSPRQDGWTDLTEIWWQCSGGVAIGFARKTNRKK
jgi:hypothetical protein